MGRLKNRFLWAGVILLCFPLPLNAYSPWTLFDRTSGLVDNTVQAIARDGSGQLWVGTKGGVSRFDGESWHNLTSKDGIPGEDVQTLFFDPGGGMWLGTGSGFGLLRDGSWSRLGLPGAVEGERVAVVSDKDGNIWFGYGEGLMRWDSSGKELSMEEELRGRAVTALLSDRFGRLWAGAAGSLHLYEEGTWETFGDGDGLPGGAVTALLEDRAGTVWCGTTEGLGEYDGVGWTVTGTREGLPNPHVTSLAEDRRGRVWVGTMGGAGWYDGYEWIWLDAGQGIPSEQVLALGTDRNGSVWIGTSRGLARYDNSWSRLHPPEDGVATLRSPLAVDDEGTVYIAAEKGFFVGEGRFAEYIGPRESFKARPTVFAFDGEGVLWVGSDNGLFSYDDGDLVHILPPAPEREYVATDFGHTSVMVRHYDIYRGLKGEIVTALAPAGEDLLWVGTTEGLSAFDGRDWDLVEENPALGRGEITALAALGESLFAGTSDGLWRKTGEEWLRLPSMKGRAVESLTVDSSGTLWAGTDEGLVSLTGEKWTQYGETEGLAGSRVHAVLRDSSGMIWVGTDAGLALFDGKHWGAYSEADGLHANSVGSIIEFQGELLVGSDGGVSVFRPDRAPPDTRIIDPPTAVVGSASRLFEFAGSDYETDLVEMRYSWSIDDGPWSPFTSRSRVAVDDLSNGTHTFRVRSMDGGLNVDPSPAAVTFQVDTGMFDVELVDTDAEDLFASLYQFYASDATAAGDPVFTATVRNRYDRPLRVKFSLFIAGLMDFSSDTVAVIDPGAPARVPLRLEMNEAVLELEQTATRQALLTMRYNLRGEVKESSHSIPVRIFQRHSMSWSDSQRIGLYITHLDREVEHFARQVVRSFREAEKETIIYDNLLRAIELFDALGAHGLRYVADPENPYVGMSGEGAALDVIRFPRETLAARTGDCDDISVLYAALLQNIGIDTALVDVSDHVFVMFDTGLRLGQEGQLTRDKSLLHIDGEKKLWVPVETTLVGGTFTEAWKKGAAALAERPHSIIDVSTAWNRYAPLQLPGASARIDVPDRKKIMPLFAQDLSLQQDNLVSTVASDLLRRIKGNSGDASARNALGIVLARYGYLRQAEAQFREVVALSPDAAAGHSNLGNVLYELERYEEAVESYRRSLSLDDGIPEIHVEIALTFCEIGRFDLARQHYEKAMELGKDQPGGVSKSAQKE